MNLRQTILAEHSKTQTDKIVRWVGESQTRFDELFLLFINDEYRVVQRAAWPLSYSVIARPALIKKHFSKLISNLHRAELPNAVKRNTLRLLQFVEIPKKFHGEIITICIDYISSNTELPAVKAFSLTILENQLKYYPEIKEEIKIIIEDRWSIEKPAFRSRAKKFLNSKITHA